MSQGDLSYVRVLPKDKIYRNIFEAEVCESFTGLFVFIIIIRRI